MIWIRCKSVEKAERSQMCGRFGLTRKSSRELADLLGVDEVDLSFHRPRYNIAPSQEHFVVISEYERRKVLRAKWGLVNTGAKDNSRAAQCINAMAETVEARTTFREAFRKRRCIVPADGFYEWTGPKQDRRPIWFHPRDGGLLLLAGLYEEWRPHEGHAETTFTILTCEPNQVTRPIHNRMPVILPDTKAQENWMNPREHDTVSLKRLLVPAPDDLLRQRPASSLVNSVQNEGPELLIPTTQGQTLDLFAKLKI
jgi:putative SOS response-associated peptidase YedK